MTDSPDRPTPKRPEPDGAPRPADDATSPGQLAPPSLDKPGDTPAPAAPAPPPAPGWASRQPPPTRGWGAPSSGGQGAAPSGGWGSPGQPPAGGPAPGWGPPAGWGGPFRQAPKPGVIPLRPLSVGEILDGAFAAMRAHWKVMVGIAIVVALLVQIFEIPVQWLVNRNFSPQDFGDDATAEEAWDYLGDTVVVSFVPLIVATLGQIAATGMLTAVVSRAVIAKTMSAKQAWASVRPLLPRLLGVTVAAWLLPVIALCVAMLPGLLLMAIGATDLGALLVMVGTVGGVVVAIHLYVCFALAAPTLMLEKQGVAKSLERSRKLVMGAWWRVCGVMLLIALIMAIVGGIIQTPFLLITGGISELTASNPSDIADPSFGDLLIRGIGAVVSSTLLFPFAAGATALLYIDQRIRREALDLELARAAGVSEDTDTGSGSSTGPTTA